MFAQESWSSARGIDSWKTVPDTFRQAVSRNGRNVLQLPPASAAQIVSTLKTEVVESPVNGECWMPAGEAKLRSFAEQRVPRCLIGLRQGRATLVLHGAAQELNVSLKPDNQLPHNRDRP